MLPQLTCFSSSGSCCCCRCPPPAATTAKRQCFYSSLVVAASIAVAAAAILLLLQPRRQGSERSFQHCDAVKCRQVCEQHPGTSEGNAAAAKPDSSGWDVKSFVGSGVMHSAQALRHKAKSMRLPAPITPCRVPGCLQQTGPRAPDPRLLHFARAARAARTPDQL